jgi:chemotaxis protein methyltransferase WspC
VRFQRGNVLAADFLSGVEPYDAIFCRNLLIYRRADQDRTIAKLCRMLTDKGCCSSGRRVEHAARSRPVSAKVPLAFAFRRMPRRAAAQPRNRRRRTALRARRGTEDRRACGASQQPNQQADEAGPAPTPEPAVSDRIDEAFTLANQGRLEEAAALCEEQLRTTARRRRHSI